MESVAKLTREQAVAHLAALREKGRLLLVVVGDVDPAAVVAKAQAAFGALPRGSYAETPLPKVSFAKARLVAEERKVKTQYIQSAFTAPANGDPAYAAARVAMSLLRYREFEEVRTKRNLSYAPGAWLAQGGISYGVLSVSAVDPMTTMKVMFDEARRLQTEPVSAKELAATKEPLLTAYLMAAETTEGQAQLLANARLLVGDFREAGRFVEKVRAVTPEQVQDFARTYIRNLQTVQVGDPATFKDGLTLSP
jgi:zinc protease